MELFVCLSSDTIPTLQETSVCLCDRCHFGQLQVLSRLEPKTMHFYERSRKMYMLHCNLQQTS